MAGASFTPGASDSPPGSPSSTTSTAATSSTSTESSRAEAQSQPQPEQQTPQADGKSYYGYLYNEDKSPTDTLDALLRAIGQYIIDHIGDTNDKQLDARKLAAFYRTVGGDFDRLFKSPDRTLSYIWQALGVQYSLQPVPDDDFAAPSIPALTLRGFVRWQSLQILLAPEENVPFMQYAVANWDLRHPITGDPFPVDLPATAFPLVCDPAVDEWHRACGEKLREAATPSDEDEQPPRQPEPEPHADTTHGCEPNDPPVSTGATPRHQPEPDLFPPRRPMPYVHVPESRHPPPPPTPPHPSHPSKPPQPPQPSHQPMPAMPSHPSHNSHPLVPEFNRRMSSSSGSSLEGFPMAPRRPSIKTPPVLVREDTRSSIRPDPPYHPVNTRRHSQQHVYVSSIADSDSESDTLRASPRSVPQPSVIRHIPIANSSPASTPNRSRRSDLRPDDLWRNRLSGINHKLTPFLKSPSSRQRSSSRERRSRVHSDTRSRKDIPPARLSRSLSGESFESDMSFPEMAPTYSSRDSRENNRSRAHAIERELEREREKRRERERAREWEELERNCRQDKNNFRPTITRRTSSHADIDRRRQNGSWDAKDRRLDSRDLKREASRNLIPDELDRRERKRYHERGLSPSMNSIGPRIYAR
ncbi:hypothetical protein GGR50DRAFT_148218 [Xylaria sp. CBS 124048]|nr:hypothetical protein GGR50DRAFT_148218 [Xylaria sp. CBS 124048]